MLRIPIWLAALSIAIIIALVVSVGFLSGRVWETSRFSAGITPIGHESPQASLSNSSKHMEDHIVGIWAFADGGCGTGYGATYTAQGRFAEGDEFSGIEGRWRIRGTVLERQNIVKYQLREADGTLVTDPVAGTNRFAITTLTTKDLIFSDKANRFAYIKCPGGRHVFADGEIVES